MVTENKIYKRFRTQDDCRKFMEEVFWNGKPKCPYCHSRQNTPMIREGRYHCNGCNSSYSVTVDTVFHKTKVEIQKWFYLLSLMASGVPLPSLRIIAGQMHVTKDTVAKMISRIKEHYPKDKTQFDIIVNHIENGK